MARAFSNAMLSLRRSEMKEVTMERSLEMKYIERGKAGRFYGAVRMSGCILRYREVFKGILRSCGESGHKW